MRFVQVLGDVTAGGSVPQGPNNVSGDPGAGGSTISLNFTDNPAAASFGFASNAPGRVYIDGATVYCVGGTISGASSSLTNCTTTQSGGLTITPGNAITTDLVVPAASQPGTGLITQTTGLVAPDGIVGVIPARLQPRGGWSPYGAPPNSTVVIYGEKILNLLHRGDDSEFRQASRGPHPSPWLRPRRRPSPFRPRVRSPSTRASTAGIQQVTCTGCC